MRKNSLLNSLWAISKQHDDKKSSQTRAVSVFLSLYKHQINQLPNFLTFIEIAHTYVFASIEIEK